VDSIANEDVVSGRQAVRGRHDEFGNNETK
jgi:hypothetical protein